MADAADDTVRTLFKSGSILFVGIVIELGISFFAKVLIAQVLGPVNYGVVSLGITTATVVSTLTLVGVNLGIGRYLPRYDDPAKRRGVLVSGYQLVVPLAVVSGVAIALGAPVIANRAFHDPALVPILRVFGLAIPLAAMMKLSIGVVQGLQKSLQKVYIRNITEPVVRFGAVAVALALGMGALGVAWAYVASYAVAVAVGGYVLVKQSSLFDRTVPAASMHRELLAFSFPLVISTAMTLVFSDIDTFMLGYFKPSGHVGIYNTVYPLAYLLTATVSSFSFIFMPVVSELHSDGRTTEMRRLYKVVTKWIFLVTFPVFVVMTVFPETVIGITFGPEYVPGALALSILAVAFFSHSVAGPNVNALTSVGLTKRIMYVNVFTAVLNISLNLVLIPKFSYLGAAVATALSYVLLNVIYSALLYRVTGMHPFSRSLASAAAAGAALAVSLYVIARYVLSPTLPVVAASVVGFGALYAVGALRFGVEREEVMLVLSFEERMGVDLGPLKAIARRILQ